MSFYSMTYLQPSLPTGYADATSINSKQLWPFGGSLDRHLFPPGFSGLRQRRFRVPEWIHQERHFVVNHQTFWPSICLWCSCIVSCLTASSPSHSLWLHPGDWPSGTHYHWPRSLSSGSCTTRWSCTCSLRGSHVICTGEKRRGTWFRRICWEVSF